MRIVLFVTSGLATAALLLPAGAGAAIPKQATAVGKGGAAATVDLKGTRAAIRTLRRGGNAVDAAVAAAGVLGVTEPFSCGIGGRSEEHTSELQSHSDLVCRLLLEKKKK